jgi:hypothetical protein
MYTRARTRVGIMCKRKLTVCSRECWGVSVTEAGIGVTYVTEVGMCVLSVTSVGTSVLREKKVGNDIHNVTKTPTPVTLRPPSHTRGTSRYPQLIHRLSTDLSTAHFGALKFYPQY